MLSDHDLIQLLRRCADELESRQGGPDNFKGVDLNAATNEDIEWLRSMGRNDLLREIEYRRSGARSAAISSADSSGAGGGDSPTGNASPASRGTGRKTR